MAAKDFFERIRDKLFPQDDNKNVPAHSERIQRSDDYMEVYKKWIESERAEEVLTRLRSFWQYKWQGGDDFPEFHVHRTPQANGFYFIIDSFFRKAEADFLFDLFRDRVSEMEYRLYTSDRRWREKEEVVEQREKHYLKPEFDTGKLKDETARIPQRYGNVLIELVRHDNEPHHLKLMANIYAGNNYEDPWSFKELVDQVLGKVGA